MDWCTANQDTLNIHVSSGRDTDNVKINDRSLHTTHTTHTLHLSSDRNTKNGWIYGLSELTSHIIRQTHRWYKDLRLIRTHYTYGQVDTQTMKVSTADQETLHISSYKNYISHSSRLLITALVRYCNIPYSWVIFVGVIILAYFDDFWVTKMKVTKYK